MNYLHSVNSNVSTTYLIRSKSIDANWGNRVSLISLKLLMDYLCQLGKYIEQVKSFILKFLTISL